MNTMKRFWPILVSLLAWAVIALYIFWSSELGQRRRSQVVVDRLAVTIADSMQTDLFGTATVREWIEDAGLDPTGKLIGEVNHRELTECITSHGSVRDARVYVDLEGTVHVTLVQRKPIMRVITAEGYDFYTTKDGHVLPAAGYAAQYMPVVTGSFGLPFDKSFAGDLVQFAGDSQKKAGENYIFLCKLINFVKYIGESDFWRSQIVQINVTEPGGGGASRGAGRFGGEPRVEFVPRIGDHVVSLGRLDGFEGKLDNLMLFYRQAVPVEGWAKWKRIDLGYDGQIVCR